MRHCFKNVLDAGALSKPKNPAGAEGDIGDLSLKMTREVPCPSVGVAHSFRERRQKSSGGARFSIRRENLTRISWRGARIQCTARFGRTRSNSIQLLLRRGLSHPATESDYSGTNRANVRPCASAFFCLSLKYSAHTGAEGQQAAGLR